MQALAEALERQGFGGPRVTCIAHEVAQDRDAPPVDDEPCHEWQQPRADRFRGPADLVAMPLRRFARREAPAANPAIERGEGVPMGLLIRLELRLQGIDPDTATQEQRARAALAALPVEA